MYIVRCSVSEHYIMFALVVTTFLFSSLPVSYLHYLLGLSLISLRVSLYSRFLLYTVFPMMRNKQKVPFFRLDAESLFAYFPLCFGAKRTRTLQALWTIVHAPKITMSHCIAMHDLCEGNEILIKCMSGSKYMILGIARHTALDPLILMLRG
jgi:hypothetical protein